VFCDQKSIIGHDDGMVSPDLVREKVIDFLGHRGSRRGPVEVAFYGGNFLGLPKTYRTAVLDEAQDLIREGKAHSIRFSTRPDPVSLSHIGALAAYSIGAIELGVQSMDDHVLGLNQRGHTAKDTCRSVQILKSHGFSVGLQIMPGLPGDTSESILETGSRVAALSPDFVRIYPTVVVKGTVLEKWFRSGRYEPLTLDQAVEITKKLLAVFTKHDIPVIRMGLQVSTSLLAPGNIVAGPFHPAFGHLVHSAVFLDIATRQLENNKGLSKRMELGVFPKDVAKLTGQNRNNLERLVKRFNLKEIRVSGDSEVPRNTVRVKCLADV
jgi:histone acetyltransferase (RNA polymerase elongator complex component)